jgi:hypothetical protein
MQPKGDAEIAENNLAKRLTKALKKKKVGEDPELEECLVALPREPTVEDQTMVAIRALGRLPKRRKNPLGEAQIAENKLARTLSLLRKNTKPARAQESLQAEEDSVHGTSSPSSVAAVLIANNPTRSQPKRALKLHHTV